MLAFHLAFHRPGRGRVQALLILVLVLVTAGLILAGVGRLRQLAAQMSCRNNLRQLGFGIQNYYDSAVLLPPLVDQGEKAKAN